RVVSQQRRDFQSPPPVHALGLIVGRAEQVSCASEIFQRQIKEESFAGLPASQLFLNGRIVSSALLDGLVKDRRIRRQPSHRQLVDVALQRAGIQQVARDVIQPNTLSKVVQ